MAPSQLVQASRRAGGASWRAGVASRVVALAVTGCTGLIEVAPTTEEPAAEEVTARKAWTDKAEPHLTAACASCHVAQAGSDFLSGGESLAVRDRVLSFAPSVVDLSVPGASRLLTKGLHAGPEWSAAQTSDLLEWMRAERDAQVDATEPLATRPIAPQICATGTPIASCPVNTVALDDVGLAGAKIQFVALGLSGKLYLNALELVGGPGGAYIEHPLFVSVGDAAVVADPIDRFVDLELNVAAGAKASLDGGAAMFASFPVEHGLAIHFKVVKPFQPDKGPADDPTAQGGCKDLASFKANAAPQLSMPVAGAAQACTGCHLAGTARSALDLTGVTSATDADVQRACNQVKTRVNLTTPDSSGLFLAPAPTSTSHPFRFTAPQAEAFRTGPAGSGVLGWITAERSAP